MTRLTILHTSNRKRIIWAIAFLFVFVAIAPFGGQDAVQYIDRADGQLKTEKIAGEEWLRWLYQNPLGEATLATLVKRKFVSEWYGDLMDSPGSKDKIAPFVEEYQIDLSESVKQEFDSFNDFFTRKLKPEVRSVSQARNVIVSPGDGKLLAYSDITNQDFIVKGYRFELKEFLQNDSLANVFQHGSLMILRLCPTDYHRYHFPVSGEVIEERKIDGDYYSVSPIALRKKIELLVQNKREYAVINSPEFGSVIMSE
ncbi:MAG TPA: phosphatidylserine decarboxylase, partial [Saprospiraceae bacterium]|nr:phosphatidylserine decarboxylase [Saprospiraceae bacterium]